MFGGSRVTRLPTISGRDCIRALEKAGFVLARQKGSHMIMFQDDPAVTIPVPNRSELGRGLLRAIIREAGLSVEEFLRLLE